MTRPTILIIGTGDTKADEIKFIERCIAEAGGDSLLMDVSVLGDPPYKPDFDRHAVLGAVGRTVADAIKGGDEMSAMTLMAEGASTLVRQLHQQGRIDGMLALGGTMGTDLALDVALILPLGFPKVVVSTIAFSHLLPPDRIATDLIMILWAGGLYGLNSVCQTSLSQAAGAVMGAVKSVVRPPQHRPIIGMSSLGKTCLRYMVGLKPELERRGYELVVFHTTGMGGRALEALAAQRAFAAVMDFSLQEVANFHSGSVVQSGPDRLENAGRVGIPQIVAPGAIDMIDLPAWQPPPAGLGGSAYYAHNRLIGMVISDPQTRRAVARKIAAKLSMATAPVAFILPEEGVEQWDQPGEPFYDPEGLAAFVDEIGQSIVDPVELHRIKAHINSAAFVQKALEIFDDWVAKGIIPKGRPQLGTAA